VRRHNRTHTKVGWWKCSISKIQHGGWGHFENRYIWAANRPNLRKFGVQTHVLTMATEMWQNSEIRKFKMADGRHIENYCLARTWLHIVRLRWNLEWGATIARVHRLVDENVLIWKSNMADSRHFENRCLYIWAANFPNLPTSRMQM